MKLFIKTGLISAVVLGLLTSVANAERGQRGDREARDGRDFSRIERVERGPTVLTPQVRGDRFVERNGHHYHVDRVHHRSHIVPRRAIRRKLRRRGMEQTSKINLRKGRYHVRAIGPRGAHLKLVFSARNGQLIRVRVLRGPTWRGPVFYGQYSW
ncbi:MAG: hypothetical protein AAGA88_08890 [Pseudomonadota bacterium]